MGLEGKVKETWSSNHFCRIFNIKEQDYKEIASQSISALSIENILLQLGHYDIIPLQDFRKEFEQVYIACLLASLAHHGKKSTQQRLAQRLGVSAPTIKDYEPFYKKIHTINRSAQSLFFTTLDKVIKKENRHLLAQAYGKLVMEIFNHYMRVIEDGGCGIPYLEASFNSLYSQIEKKYVEYAMNQSNFNQMKTAKRLGVSRQTLISLCARYGLMRIPLELRHHVFRPASIKDRIIAYLRLHKYSIKKTCDEFSIPASQILSIAENEFSELRQRLFDAVKSGQIVSAAAQYIGVNVSFAWSLFGDLRDEIRELEKRNIQQAVSSAGNFAQAAEQLGIKEKRLYKKRIEYSIA